MIEISNVTKQFYTLKAIDNVTFRIPRGEVVGLLGPNGAGKTTLFKLIAGILRPDKGRIRALNGRWPRIGYKTDRLLFPNQMRVSQYLTMVAELSGISDDNVGQAVFESLAQVGLVEAANKRIRDCSKGMRQRLGLAQALIGNPPLLLLDEPSNGLDPAGQTDIQRRLKEQQAAGKTILISSHQLQEITAVCTHLIILNRGRIHYQNSMVDALTVSPHTVIRTDQPLGIIRESLSEMHPDIHIERDQIVLRGEAMALRRQVLARLLQANYDVVHVEQKHITLAEIYQRAIQ